MLNDALNRGAAFPWDYEPRFDPSKLYVRREFSTQETKRRQRWPYVPNAEP